MNQIRLLAASSCLLLLSTAALVISRRLLPTDEQCMVHMWPYSPAFGSIQHSWINLAEYYYPSSPLRGDANQKPDLEGAWRNYTYQGVISFPYESIPKLEHHSTEAWWPVTPVEGGGVAAVLSIHYQTNCLNLIRKYVHRHTYDYSDEDAFNSSRTAPAQLRDQVGQCIEALRQELVCHVDQSLYLIWKDPKALAGWNEDNAVRHKCRDYSQIKDWAERNTVRNLNEANLYFPLISSA